MNSLPNLTTREAARRLGVSPRTLEKWRVEGNGPAFFKVGRRVAYLEADLDAWLRTRRCRSTSEAATWRR